MRSTKCWNRIVNAVILVQRLDAEIILYAEDSLLAELSRLGAELRFVLITSGATALPLSKRVADAEATDIPGLWVKVIVSENVKCARCWQRREDVGVNPEHPTICGRCVENIVSSRGNKAFCVGSCVKQVSQILITPARGIFLNEN